MLGIILFIIWLISCLSPALRYRKALGLRTPQATLGYCPLFAIVAPSGNGTYPAWNVERSPSDAIFRS